ncbi:MAG: LuxR family transcriptional regulator [Burkholderiales bacterium]|nr:MAG: LuxR family transcriptional regulator [Burkholderiales bacterium]
MALIYLRRLFMIYPRLTRREIEVIELVADGFTKDEIAEELFISPCTVKNHTKNILDKYNCNRLIKAVGVYMFDKGRLHGKE